MHYSGIFSYLIVAESGALYAWGDGIATDAGEVEDSTLDVPTESLGKGKPVPSRRPSQPQRRKLGKVKGLEGINICSLACNKGKLYGVENVSGRVYEWDLDSDREKKDSTSPIIPRLVNRLQSQCISHVSCGSGFAIAISVQGEVFTWGSTAYGCLGLGEAIAANVGYIGTPQMIPALNSRVVVKASCGWAHAMVVLAEGLVYAWGCNWSGRLGLGSATHTHYNSDN